MELQHQNNANKSNWLQMNVYMPLTLCPLLIIVYALAHFFYVFMYLIVYICLRVTTSDIYNIVEYLTCFLFFGLCEAIFPKTTNNHYRLIANVLKWLYASCQSMYYILWHNWPLIWKSNWSISLEDFFCFGIKHKSIENNIQPPMPLTITDW